MARFLAGDDVCWEQGLGAAWLVLAGPGRSEALRAFRSGPGLGDPAASFGADSAGGAELE